MKRLFVLMIACALSVTTACATIPAAGGTAPVISTQQTLLDERILFGAEAAYNVAASAYLSADSRGQLSPSVKATARAALTKSYDALLLARQAHAAGEASTFTAQAAAALAFASEARALIPQ